MNDRVDKSMGIVTLMTEDLSNIKPIEPLRLSKQAARRKKKNKDSWVNLKGGGQLATKTGDGEQMCGMVPRTGVSERLPSAHPVVTSVRCVWTQVHAGVVAICSDQPVSDRCVVFGFVARWKEGLVNMINRNFARHLMMGVFSRVCSGVLWG
jgi:hypothetical protein